MNNFKIAILDDEKEILTSLSNILLKEGFEVFCFQNINDFNKSLEKIKFDILFLDVFLGEGISSGLEILKKLKNDIPELNIIMISGNADIKTAAYAIKLGARDFIEKPLHLKDILEVIQNITTKITIKNERNQLLNDLLSKYEILGKSQIINEIKSQIIQYSNLNEPILILGESGTGKELVAANLHYNSVRRSNQYYKVNISSLSETIIESELFGHKKGSFSGANENKEGLFVVANNSTLFLDEIGEMKFDIQSKMLRSVQEKEIIPVGSTVTEKFNTRLIFATNKNLIEEVKNKNFREDLYYRISSLKIEIPPLRERLEDIEILSNKFILDFSIENNFPIKEISNNALKKLENYSYPGNIRELKNIIIRVILRNNNRVIDEKDIDFENNTTQNNFTNLKTDDVFEKTETLAVKKKELEKIYIEAQLKKNNYDLQKTSDELGLLIPNFYRKMKELNIEHI